MAEKIYLASKESIDSLSTNVSSIKTNTGNLVNRLGTVNDTTSATGTTLNSRVNYIVNALTDSGGSNSEGNINAKLRTITERLGITGNSGGTQTAGTAMAKLNNIINTTEGTNTHVANLITSVGTSSDSSSSSGTSLQSKLKYVVNGIDSVYNNLLNVYDLNRLVYGTTSGGAVKYELNIDGSHPGSTYTFYYYFPFPTFNPVIRLRPYNTSSTIYLTQGAFYNLGVNFSSVNCSLGSSFTSSFTQSNPLYTCPQGSSLNLSFVKKNNSFIQGAKISLNVSSTNFYPQGFLFRGVTTVQSDDFYIGFYGVS